MRECGECTLCCLVLPIQEIKSEPGKLCSHCDLKSGCTIYNTRPVSCINFKCSWLCDNKMSEGLRPDRTNIIFEKITDEIHIGTLNPNNIIGWNKSIVLDYIKLLNNKGISVIITSFTNIPKLFMLAEGKTEEEVMKEAMTEYDKEFKK